MRWDGIGGRGGGRVEMRTDPQSAPRGADAPPSFLLGVGACTWLCSSSSALSVPLRLPFPAAPALHQLASRLPAPPHRSGLTSAVPLLSNLAGPSPRFAHPALPDRLFVPLVQTRRTAPFAPADPSTFHPPFGRSPLRSIFRARVAIATSAERRGGVNGRRIASGCQERGRRGRSERRASESTLSRVDGGPGWAGKPSQAPGRRGRAVRSPAAAYATRVAGGGWCGGLCTQGGDRDRRRR